MVVGLWVTWKILYRNNDTSLERKQTGKERWVAFKKHFGLYYYLSLLLWD